MAGSSHHSIEVSKESYLRLMCPGLDRVGKTCEEEQPVGLRGANYDFPERSVCDRGKPAGESVSTLLEGPWREEDTKCRWSLPWPLTGLPGQFTVASHSPPKIRQLTCAQHVPWDQPFSYLNLTTTLGSRISHYPCFTNGETEAQKG